MATFDLLKANGGGAYSPTGAQFVALSPNAVTNYLNAQAAVDGGSYAAKINDTAPNVAAYLAAAAAEVAAPTLPVVTALSAKDASDAAAAKAYVKLQALQAMTPAQVQAWVTANVTNLAQAQDAIMTLAVAVSVLARRL